MSGHDNKSAASRGTNRMKLLVFTALVLASFALSYNYALAKGDDPVGTKSSLFAGGASTLTGGGSSGCACCGDSGPAVEGATTVEGDVQRITVDTSAGSFNPNVIKAKAGVPIVIDFTQAAGGCLSGVYFPDFNIDEDLTAGPKTITLPALDPGEYQFFCQMQMVSAKIVVE